MLKYRDRAGSWQGCQLSQGVSLTEESPTHSEPFCNLARSVGLTLSFRVTQRSDIHGETQWWHVESDIHGETQ